MSEDNKLKNPQTKQRKKKKKKKSKIGQVFKVVFLTLLVVLVIGVGIGGGMVISIIKDAPDIDPTNIGTSLDQTSFILTPDGELIEKIQAPEFRTVVSINQIPKHLQNAFIAIEDERFEQHIGVDPKGIGSSLVANIKAGRIVRGASTITQQLVKNVYLTNEKKLDRKIKEAYLALQVEKVLSKDQIMELYLNRIFLGQNAYGVQEAAQTYFSKNVEDLTIAESALLAGVVKSPSRYSPYETLRPENFNSEKHQEVANLDILGEKYIAVYNPESIKRQELVLSQMYQLGKITKAQYDEALNENIRENLKPAQKKVDGISSYFSDYVKTQVVDALVEQLGYTKDEAQNELFTGGLKIYSTIDLKLQRELEDIYNNFTDILAGGSTRAPVLISWKLNGNKDIIDENNNIIYYKKDNLFNENFELKIGPGEYEFRDGDLFIHSKKLNPYAKHIDVADYYSIDDRNNLMTYTIGSITIPEDLVSIGENKEILIRSRYLNDNPNFQKIDEHGNLLISDEFFFRSKDGIVQPQSAAVVSDYKTGQIKALVGGRDIEGTRILNRATSSQRQPGSAMKPIATYWPALDNGFTAASAIDDIPFYANGKLWPRNWYRDGYRGIYSLRKSVEQSGNVNAVKVVDAIGPKTSMVYLERMGIIKKTSPGNDSFITAAENKSFNDENLSALGLGGMTRGLTPLEVTAAYGAIANNGIYLKPIAFTKIEDKNGNILLDNIPHESPVTSPQVAYIMSDILRTTVTNGIAGRAKMPNMATAGKTGTTTDQADIWFVGYTPYYVTGVWIGNDSPKITLTKGSGTAIQLWKHIMTRAHDGLEPVNSFPKPEGIVSANVCSQSGLLPGPLCSRDPRGSTIVSEIFAAGTVPTKTCDVHVEVKIDTASGKIATEFCPPGNIRSSVFIKRTPPYIPSDHDGITPTDYGFTAPSQVCNLHTSSTPVETPKYEDDDKPDGEEEEEVINGEDNGDGTIKDKDKDKSKDKDKPKDNESDFPIDLGTPIDKEPKEPKPEKEGNEPTEGQ